MAAGSSMCGRCGSTSRASNARRASGGSGAGTRTFEISVRRTRLDETRRTLFNRHKQRFTENVPDSLEDFLGADSSSGPCVNVEVAVQRGSRLLAASYLDLGHAAVSSIYGFFDPDESARSLGIFTMLVEIEFACQRGCRHYYPGYAYLQPSHYDYKKQFHGLEAFDWKAWAPMPRWTGR